MSDFLEERLSVAVKYGATYGDEYAVNINRTSNGSEYRQLLHPFPVRQFHFAYDAKATTLYANIANTYHRAFGKFAGFRVKCLDDFTTNGQTAAPTAFDQTLQIITQGELYQLQKVYGEGGTPLAIGRPYRTLFKPVAGTVLVGIVNPTTGNNTPIAGAWTVDSTTGRITFVNKTRTITGITQAASAVISCAGHTFVVNDSVYVSGVAGMTQINGRRATVTAISAGVSITVSINSSAFSAYSSGGILNNCPQTGETVTGGCEFDIPARFDSVLNITQNLIEYRDIASLTLVELLNP